FDAAHEVNREDNLIFASVVQEAVLDILRRLLHRSPSPFRENETVEQTAIVLYPDLPSVVRPKVGQAWWGGMVSCATVGNRRFPNSEHLSKLWGSKSWLPPAFSRRCARDLFQPEEAA